MFWHVAVLTLDGPRISDPDPAVNRDETSLVIASLVIAS